MRHCDVTHRLNTGEEAAKETVDRLSICKDEQKGRMERRYSQTKEKRKGRTLQEEVTY